MSRVERKTQKIFGLNGNNGIVGSELASGTNTGVLSQDLDDLQGLAAFEDGLNSVVLSGENLPPLEEIQSLDYIETSQLAYIFQEGIPEYDSGTTYFNTPSPSIVKKVGTTEVYKSLVNSNIGNPLSDGTKWALLGDLANIPSAALGTAAYGNTGTGNGDIPEIGTPSATASLPGLSFLAPLPTFGFSSTTAITVTAGAFPFDDGTGQARNSFSGTKTTAAFVAGSGNGGLDTGTIASNTWYYPYAISNASGSLTDYVISANPSAPNLSATNLLPYTKYTRLKGAFKTKPASSQIINFKNFKGEISLFTSTPAEQLISTAVATSLVVVTNALPVIPVKASIAMKFDCTGLGGSSLTVWGDNQSTPTSPDVASSIATNNQFSVAGTGSIFAGNGSVSFQNFTFAGGITGQNLSLLSFKDLT